MTCDERLEALLNRAGQTLIEIEPSAIGDTDNLIDYAIRSRGHAQAAVMHLTEIIDRMETALENVIGERDFIRAKCCYFCGLAGDNQTPETCEDCDVGKGVPEDWSVDDEREEEYEQEMYEEATRRYMEENFDENGDPLRDFAGNKW